MVSVKLSGENVYSPKTILQYNYGEILRIENVPENTLEVQFSFDARGGIAGRSIGQIVDGALEVEIPDEMLENNDARSNYQIFAFPFWRDDKSGKTLCRIIITVEARPRPGNVIPKGQPNFEEQLVAAVMEERKKAEEQVKEAESWAHGRDDHPDRAEDNAKYYAEKAAESAKQAGTDRTGVERLKQSVDNSSLLVEDNLRQTETLKSQAQTAAENALISERNAKESENAAAVSRTGAETAEESARQYAQEVLEHKNAVEQNVSGFDGKVAAAVEAIQNKGAETLASIPEDYTALQKDVGELKGDLRDYLHVDSDNIFDPSKVTKNKYVNSNGEELDTSSYELSEYIPVPFVGDNYLYFNKDAVSSEYSDYKGVHQIILYDSNKIFIKRVACIGALYGAFNQANAKYMRLIIGSNTKDLMVVVSNKYDATFSPTYIPYGEHTQKLSKMK